MISCALGGLAFFIGARAAGLALLGAVVGTIVGFLLVSSDFDRLAQGALVGATIGTFVGSLTGLAWRPSASATVLLALGSVTILVGVVIMLVGQVASQRPCHPGGRFTCASDIVGASSR